MEIKTQRLLIRRFKEQDTDDLFAYLSQDKVVKYEPYQAFTYEQAVEETKRRIADENFYAVSLKAGKMIGNLYFAKGDFDTWELGYVFNSDYWGRGYALEAVSRLLNEGFTHWNVRRVIAMCNPENKSSWQLLERTGMRREGHLRENITFCTDKEGCPVWQDTYEYAILKEEFAYIERI